MSTIPTRPFGKHSDPVSALGFGGHHLGEAEDQATATRLVRTAIDGGVTFFDNCWEFHWMGNALKGVRTKIFLMTKVCTHGREKDLAMTKVCTHGRNKNVAMHCKFNASDGRYELFKTTKKYDGDVGRQQHGFPSAAELPV